MWLGPLTRGRDNNWDVLRLVAALLVLVSHSWSLVGADPPRLAGEATLGTVGVSLFFAISGFLVARSWTSDPRLRVFLWKRALRLMPGLLAMLVVTAWVIGPLATEEDLGAYLASTQVPQYVLQHSLFHEGPWLPGVFADNPLPHAVNGSLWTLPVEVKMYAFLAVLGLIGLIRVALVPIAMLVGLAVWIPDANPATLNFLHGILGATLMGVFLGGVLLFQLRRYVPLHAGGALLAAAGIWLSLKLPDQGLQIAAWAIAFPYLAAWLAYRTPARWRAISRPGDASYGMYIYGFPIQQALVAALALSSPAALLVLCVPLTYSVGLVSWRLVEAPALRLKRLLPMRVSAEPPGPASPERWRQAPVNP